MHDKMFDEPRPASKQKDRRRRTSHSPKRHEVDGYSDSFDSDGRSSSLERFRGRGRHYSVSPEPSFRRRGSLERSPSDRSLHRHGHMKDEPKKDYRPPPRHDVHDDFRRSKYDDFHADYYRGDRSPKSPRRQFGSRDSFVVEDKRHDARPRWDRRSYETKKSGYHDDFDYDNF